MTFDGNGLTGDGSPDQGGYSPYGGFPAHATPVEPAESAAAAPGSTGQHSPAPTGGRAAARKAARSGNGRRAAGQPADAAEAAAQPGGRAAARGRGAGKLSKAAKRKRILKYGAAGVGFLVVASVGGGYLYIQQLNSNIRKGDLNNGGAALAPPSKPNAAGQTPLNILMIGSDGRTSAADCKLGGSCDGSAPHADVEMLVHLSADRSNASIMSIPRDTQAAIPTCTNPTTKAVLKARHSIITDSLNVGDPGCVVDTWEQLTKIHIDHYMMVDFAGVVNMADAIGGVSVCTKENVMDFQPSTDAQGVHHEIGSHLVLPAGTHSIQGEQALEWLRTRHAFGDGTDIGRAQAQHLYINSMIRSFKSAKTLADPLKLNDLAQAATKALQVDTGLGTVDALASLALELNKVPTARITTVTMPWAYQKDPGNPSADLVETTPDSAKLFQMIAADVALDRNAPPTGPAPSDPAAASSAPASSAPAAPPVDKAAVRIDVQNGSGGTGRSTAVTDALTAQGYTHATRDTTLPPKSPTKLLYPAAQQAQAKAVAASLGLPDSALSESTVSATHLTLVVGTDWTTGTSFPGGTAAGAASQAAAPVPTALPTTAQSQNAQDDANQCMDVNPAPYSSFKDGQNHYIYSWTGPNTPNVPQP
ncbi:LCP family protein required for cell wall assembly [Kitasatospora sp. GAS204A]|uniref:LCP family protein n=1 Tax=unclassified Kitasatospora TaxID=2633591 RepID=UPI0024764794|nr:LCP family protein [Kitasatospora sp. GAS204B]MDH6117527.1 LCP family protein required for cell wall assembly [Kitasatospora sp. GAS204B]